MRRTIVAGNWKMHGSLLDTRKIILGVILELTGKVPVGSDLEVVFIPPFVYIPEASQLLKDSQYALGAQNVHWEEKGAFTGEISPTMLSEFGVKYVVVGHSERRHIFGETSEMVAKRFAGAVQHGLIPILCVGETLEQRKAGKTYDVVFSQLRPVLEHISEDTEFVIAYEPVWAIGTGVPATKEDAEDVIMKIREFLGAEIGRKDITVLYGGSVKPANVESFASSDVIDGALVGGASLKPLDFAEIVKAFAKRREE